MYLPAENPIMAKFETIEFKKQATNETTLFPGSHSPSPTSFIGRERLWLTGWSPDHPETGW